MRILYFGTYKPTYSRNRVLIKGLKQNGVEVLECCSSRQGFKSFFELFFKHLIFIGKYDYMVVGFPGQEVMFLARFLTSKPIIFDTFTSHYGGYIIDRQYFSKKSLRAKYYRFLDKWSCKLANFCLLDTNAHIDFFVEEFKLPREKFLRIFVGTDSDIFFPKKVKKSNDKFLVHFHGHYIPLQGVKYIIRAAKFLEDEDIIFNLIGKGQTFEADKGLAERIRADNINFIDSVPYDKLPDYIGQADVCLGIFGDSPKTELVIPNKIYDGLAMAKPVITADTKAVRELLSEDVNAFFCKKADFESLAKKILLARDNSVLTNQIAQNGFKLFEEKLKEKKLGAELLENINEKIALRK